MKDYYSILGIEKGATDEEIKSAYRKMAAKYHPDVSTDPNANERMAEINEAYSILKDPQKRANYDEYGFSNTSNSSNYSGYGNNTSSSYTYYNNYNPNQRYYDYSNGFVYRKNTSYLFRFILRMAIFFFIIQAIAALVNLFINNKNSSSSSVEFSYSQLSDGSLEIEGVSTGLFSLSNPQNSLTTLTIHGTYTYRMYSYTISSIGSEAFRNYKYLTTVYLSDSITTINEYAFYGCSKLETIYYSGTEEEFKNITIGTGNSNFKNASVVYNSSVD